MLVREDTPLAEVLPVLGLRIHSNKLTIVDKSLTPDQTVAAVILVPVFLPLHRRKKMPSFVWLELDDSNDKGHMPR